MVIYDMIQIHLGGILCRNSVEEKLSHVHSVMLYSELQRKRSDSPEPSWVSMKSDASMGPPLNFKTGNPSSVHSELQRKRSDSPEPSWVSVKSDASMGPPLNFKNGNPSPVHSVLQKAGDRREKIITDTGHAPESPAVNEFQKKFRLNLMKKFQCLNGVIIKQENRVLLNEIYTELYITEGDSGDVNKEHEVRQIEAASRRKTTEETPIKCNDIFKPLSEEDEPIRTVVTKGVAGIGKTVSVQKFIVDWAEGKANQDVPLIFPLPFRELNLMKDQKLSLMELLHVCFKETKETEMSRLEKVLFIFDGLDECRFPLDFRNTVRVCDVTESASVRVLLINLIKGNLLPSALIWITSRPAAADQIPSEYVHRVTEIQGFNDPQKEEYFRKRINDQSLAENIITHLKSLRSLYIMCHIPVFCWISAAVLERMLGEAESGEIPKTLTQMYTHFLIIQTNIISGKYSKKQESDEEMLLKLGKLAFEQLEKGNLIFYEEDLRVCGIDVTEAAVYSGVCTQIFREEVGLHQSKVYCFIHLSVQEHLAALYVHLTFMKEKRNVLVQIQCFKTISDVHRSAVVLTFKSQTGHLDLFLRFLLGLSLESNQKLLHALVTQTGSSSQSKEETVHYITEMISEDDLPAEKCINLFHCLNELGDDSLVEEIQRYLKSGKQSELSPSQWSALVFVLLTSAQELEEFDLSKYTSTEKIPDWVLVKVMPVIAASRKAVIRYDTIKGRSAKALVSVLNSETSSLRELHLTVKTLDLTGNKLEDSGVKRLCAGLENPHCEVETLGLSGMLGHLLPADQDIQRELVQFSVDLTIPSFKEGESIVEWWGHVFDKPDKYPSLGALVKCCLSIFHGPRVESSFSLMNDVIDQRSDNMNVETFNAIQTVKYTLMSRGKTAMQLFRREDVKFGEVDRTLCKNINSAAATYKHQQRVNKEEKQQSKYGSQATCSAQQAKKQTAEREKRARLKHVATRRKRAMETLVVQANKRKKLSLFLVCSPLSSFYYSHFFPGHNFTITTCI
ncbi:NLR family CARD domain-containing protein 3-like isoform X6 [Neoarius graeffei]|uniref:NLR family CARD domain-containing protein 3-like isoform X6 n=1 Tax=Neoarius graeffei TaxID=443677 RepID=UPI00298CC720|nr:NLR family CARD domain-containing protein 3-like isoform X6 [Neoarius graeffei]